MRRLCGVASGQKTASRRTRCGGALRRTVPFRLLREHLLEERDDVAVCLLRSGFVVMDGRPPPKTGVAHCEGLLCLSVDETPFSTSATRHSRKEAASGSLTGSRKPGQS